MSKYPLVSIIIATCNSGRMLPRVLDSVRRQTYPSSGIEILIVDGASSDNTKKIAMSYGCRVIDNPKILPAWGKYVGYKAAKGTYAMYLDSDEVIESENSITRKIDVLMSNGSVRAVTGSGYKSPKHYPFLNTYINEIGDPFTFFYYRSSRDYRFFIRSMEARYHIVSNNSDHIVFDFSDCRTLPIFELVAMGTIIDISYLKSHVPDILSNPGLIPHMFNLLVSRESHIAIIKNDPLIHYSSDSIAKYVGKINSRVVSNIYTSAEEGFNGRDKLNRGVATYKKYFFVPYSFSIVLPFVDAVYLSATRRNIGYLLHVPLCFYTTCLILYYIILKTCHIQPVFKSYGGTKSIPSP